MLKVKLVSNQIVSEEQVKAMVLEVKDNLTYFDVVTVVENWNDYLDLVGQKYSEELLRSLKDKESIYPGNLLHFAVMEAEYILTTSKTSKDDAIDFLTK